MGKFGWVPKILLAIIFVQIVGTKPNRVIQLWTLHFCFGNHRYFSQPVVLTLAKFWKNTRISGGGQPWKCKGKKGKGGLQKALACIFLRKLPGMYTGENFKKNYPPPEKNYHATICVMEHVDPQDTKSDLLVSAIVWSNHF